MTSEEARWRKAGRWLRSVRRRALGGLILIVGLALFALAVEHRLFRTGGPVDHWQTLIAGVIAVVAALIGGYFVNAQIRLSKQQEDERLRRRHAATRAIMPLTLSAVMEYARHCGRALRLLYLATPGEAARAEQLRDFDLPMVPGDKIQALADIIEAGEPQVGKALAQLLKQLQIQDGRLRSTKADILDPHSHTRSVLKVVLDDYIIDVADIYARCEGMLDYAREESDVVEGEPTAADLRRALTLMSFHEAAFDRVKATIERRYGTRAAPAAPA